MPDSETTVLRLTFGTETPGKTYTMEFNSPKPDLTEALIRQAMQLFIDGQVVAGKNGLLTTIEGAEIVTRQVTSLLG